MRKLLITMSFLAIGVTATSCKFNTDPTDPTPVVSDCEFNEPREFVMQDFGLKIPNYMSTYFTNVFPYGGVIYNLNTVLETKGNYDYTKNKASVEGKLTSDGQECKGFNEFKYAAGNSNVLPNSIYINVPSNGSFYGEVTISVRTDDFVEQYNNNPTYYVRWRVTENDPDNFVDGSIVGQKISYNPNFESIYIPKETPIYSDGGNQLIPSTNNESTLN